MHLESLRVLNLSKAQSDSLAAASFRVPGAFCLDSCQRVLLVCHEEGLAGAGAPKAFSTYSGARGYEFLLRVAAGLESQVKGETDVFGQMKDAWKRFEAAGSVQAPQLRIWIQRVFEDTKEIRANYLQNQGGSSYGSLVRRWMREHGLSGPVLLLGAGQLAQSVAPFLLPNENEELWVWNRSFEKLAGMMGRLSGRRDVHGELRAEMILGLEQEARAWREAKTVIACIPFGELDVQRMEWWKQGGTEGRAVIHLGGMKNQAGAWSDLPGFCCLDDLFELQKNQEELRSCRYSLALKACEERAKLRALGNSVTIPHGWEDLAVFALFSDF